MTGRSATRQRSAARGDALSSQRPHFRAASLLHAQPIAQRQAERFGLDLKNVALLRLDICAERKRCSAKEVNVDIAWSPEKRVFEMVRLEIGDRVRHVLFTGEERLFPDQLAAAPDPRDPLNLCGKIAHEQLRADARRA